MAAVISNGLHLMVVVHYFFLGAQGVLCVAVFLFGRHGRKRAKNQDERDSCTTAMLCAVFVGGIVVLAAALPSELVGSILTFTIAAGICRTAILVVIARLMLRRFRRWWYQESEQSRRERHRAEWGTDGDSF